MKNERLQDWADQFIHVFLPIAAALIFPFVLPYILAFFIDGYFNLKDLYEALNNGY